jgi:transcriptional regulator with XRE-family HTH domain
MNTGDALWASARARSLLAARDIGATIRFARQARGWRQDDLARAAGYSRSTISRLETGARAGTDIDVIRRVAGAAGIPSHLLSQLLGITAPPAATVGRSIVTRAEADEVRRRQLMASLGLAAASAAGIPGIGYSPAPAQERPEEVLVSRVRDAMLGLDPAAPATSPKELRAGLDGALADFRSCRYQRLSVVLPRLICAGHLLAATGDAGRAGTLLAGIYTLTTRMLIKLDDQQLGWMAADRARILATSDGDPLAAAEAARNLAVLARKAGWNDQAASIALTAAAAPGLAGDAPHLAAERGLLIQSAAYSAARAGDRAGMRELTGQAASIASGLGDRVMLRDHGGGFTPATVGLHRISAENYAGDPGAAIAAATRIAPEGLPTTERRARYWTDTARAYGTWGRRADCVTALLAAEREAPEEIRTRPSVRDLVSGLLVTGRTSPELRGLAIRCRIT